jgi:type IV pilus assembly protein PilA
MTLASSSFRRGNQRGFTLIELLVVIAIIGILSAVVLASLNTARAKGTDASIKSELNTVQTQAALDYDAYPNGYAATATSVAETSAAATTYIAGTGAPGTAGVSAFGTTASLVDQTAAAAMQQAASVTGGGIWYAYTQTTYVVEAKLTAVSGTYWCVDSTGKSEQTTVAPTTATTACP